MAASVVGISDGSSQRASSCRSGQPRGESPDRDVTIDQYIPHLKKLHSIGFDIGNQDEAVAPRTIKELDEILTAAGVAHTYETYDGTHNSRRAQRIETKMLPFFSNSLTFTTVKH